MVASSAGIGRCDGHPPLGRYGRPIAPRTLRRMAEVLHKQAVVPVVEDLIQG